MTNIFQRGWNHQPDCVSQLGISLLPKKYVTCISDIGSSNANMVKIIFCCPDAHLLFVLMLWICHTKVFFDIFSNTYQKGTLMSFQQLTSSWLLHQHQDSNCDMISINVYIYIHIDTYIYIYVYIYIVNISSINRMSTLMLLLLLKLGHLSS